MRRNVPVTSPEVRGEIRKALNRVIDFDPVVRSAAKGNDTNAKGVSGMYAYSNGATQELHIQIDGTWYKATLTAV